MTYPLTLGYVFWKGFLEYTDSSCVISAGHCSESQAKVVLLLLVASPWAGALASSARCGCWAAWLPRVGGCWGEELWLLDVKAALLLSSEQVLSSFHFAKHCPDCFPRTRKVSASGRASCCRSNFSCTCIIQSQQWRVKDWHFAYQTRDECVSRAISGRPGFRALQGVFKGQFNWLIFINPLFMYKIIKIWWEKEISTLTDQM